MIHPHHGVYHPSLSTGVRAPGPADGLGSVKPQPAAQDIHQVQGKPTASLASLGAGHAPGSRNTSPRNIEFNPQSLQHGVRLFW